MIKLFLIVSSWSSKIFGVDEWNNMFCGSGYFWSGVFLVMMLLVDDFLCVDVRFRELICLRV